MTKKSKLGI
jgi:hypothetical protein